MCGILALIQPSPVGADEVLAMAGRIRHRGPDDEGFLVWDGAGTAVFGGQDTPDSVLASGVCHSPRHRLQGSWRSATGAVVLGHRRLSIIDLSARGHQPMSYRDRYWAVYNGEVYNYIELREELRQLGHSFSSDCDSEVVLAAYAQWGPSCLSRLNGMWGLIILDAQDGKLFVARDRFGVKPVYFRAAQGRLAIASEIKAFAALSDWKPRSDKARLLDFLVWKASDHTEATLFEGVSQLLPGHYLLLDVGAARAGDGNWLGGGVRQKCWYSLDGRDWEAPADPVADLRAILEDSVRLRLRADVPVGSCLSGGVDSSAIVCMMGRQLSSAGIQGTVRTFTARSRDPAFDETRYAEAVATSARAAAEFVTPEPARLFDDLERLCLHQDEPFGSTSVFAQWCVFDLARRAGITVMLDGQGADEALGGYRGFFGAYLAGLVRSGRPRKWLAEIAAIRRQIGFSPVRSVGYTGAYLFPGMRPFIGGFVSQDYSDRGWIGRAYRSAFSEDPVRRLGGRASSLRGMSISQLSATNLPQLLHWEDRNSMAFSVEARVPFLDYRVVELCLRMSDEDKVGAGISKAVLRKSMRGLVPDLVLDRRDKMGFLTAESTWMIRDEPERFRGELRGAISVLGGIVSPTIADRFDEVQAGKRPFDRR
jgi:asparagine synthase (glutamine-hydrolysing)